MVITFKEIMELRKGDKAKAYKAAESVYKKKGGVWVGRAYAWTLYDQIAKEIPQGGYKGAEPYINEFLKLSMSSTFFMNTHFLLQMEKLYDDNAFPVFYVLRNRCFFMDEDWEKKKIDGVIHPSHAETFVAKFIKMLDKQAGVNQFLHFKPFLEDAYKRMKDNIWFCYYFGKLLGKFTKQYDRALELMMPMARENSGFYWVWESLAEVYEFKKHNKESLSCYCKALTCITEEKYLSGIKYNFALLLHKMGMDEEAKTEILEMANILSTQGRFPNSNWTFVKNKKWFLNANSKPDNNAFYQKNKKPAEKIVFGK